MRQVTKEITVSQLSEVQVSTVKQEILLESIDKISRVVKAYIGYYDENDYIVKTQNIDITDEYYNLLMSQSPDFAPNKPQNEYREVDLWYIIDLMSGQN